LPTGTEALGGGTVADGTTGAERDTTRNLGAGLEVGGGLWRWASASGDGEGAEVESETGADDFGLDTTRNFGTALGGGGGGGGGGGSSSATDVSGASGAGSGASTGDSGAGSEGGGSEMGGSSDGDGAGMTSDWPHIGQSTAAPANESSASRGCWQWGQVNFMALLSDCLFPARWRKGEANLGRKKASPQFFQGGSGLACSEKRRRGAHVHISQAIVRNGNCPDFLGTD
jgi:hypothetical protein